MMRRLSFLFLMLCFVHWSPVFAQSTVAGIGAGLVPQAGMIGVAAGVKGLVQLKRAGQVGKVVGSGEALFLADEIKTDEKGSLQILLLDETAFTIGPNSALVIDKFIYDPATDRGKVNARVIKGTFRFITGKIARKKPEDMQVALPAGTIGIRGTMVIGSVRGMRSLVVLTGPGAKNNTGSKQGEIVVSNEENGKIKSVRIAKTGFGTVIEGPGKAPTTPFQVPEDTINEITGALSFSGSDASENTGAEEGTATKAAGQDVVDAGEDLSATESVGAVSTTLAAESTTASQKAAETSGQIQDGITTIQQLLSIQSGQFHFSGGNFPLLSSSSVQVGSFNVEYDLDFGSRTAGGGASHVDGNGSNLVGSFNFNLPAVSFDNGSGFAAYNYSNLPDSASCAGCTANVTVTAKNSGGVPAANGDISLTVQNGGTTDTGSGNAPRVAGLF